MADQTFSNGCVVLDVQKIGAGIYKLTNLNISPPNFSIIPTKMVPDGTPTEAKLIIEVAIGNVAFFKALKKFTEKEWAAIADVKTVWGFKAIASDILKNAGNVEILNIDGNDSDRIVGNEVSFDFTDAKIGGAG